MRSEFIPKPTKEQRELTALEFEEELICPRGLSTGNIRVIKPEHNDSMFYN
jgi:hypothetical protein